MSLLPEIEWPFRVPREQQLDLPSQSEIMSIRWLATEVHVPLNGVLFGRRII